LEFVVIDLETTGFRPDFDEIIEFAAVHVRDGDIVSEMSTLVRPKRSIPMVVSDLTGIDDAMVRDAPSLADALRTFMDFIGPYNIAGHNVAFDLKFVETACDACFFPQQPTSLSLDSLALARIVLPRQGEYGLGALTKSLSLEHDDKHRALADARATAHLLYALRNIATKKFSEDTIHELCRLAGNVSPLYAAWFDDVRNHLEPTHPVRRLQVIQGLAFTAVAPDSESGPKRNAQSDNPLPAADHSSTLLSEDGPLPTIFPQFEARESQQKMAEAIATALTNSQHLMVEAGTGTGKSLAYLVPAALHAHQHDKRVVVATHTLALQDQIEHRDFSILKRILPFEAKLAIFKGRTNYLCLRKVRQETDGVVLTSNPIDTQVLMMLVAWLAETSHGLREELSISNAVSTVWQRVQSESESCIGKRCAFFKGCYYFRAKNEASNADIVVTNHSLVFSDIRAGNRILPTYDDLILDEAHHVAEVATKHLGAELYLAAFHSGIGRLWREGGRGGVLADIRRRYQGDSREAEMQAELERIEAGLSTLRSLADACFTALAVLLPDKVSEYRLTGNIAGTEAWMTFQDLVAQIARERVTLNERVNWLETFAERDPDTDRSARVLDASGFLSAVTEQVSVLEQAVNLPADEVVWLERSGPKDRPFWSIHLAPISVASRLRESIFEAKDSVIMTSATLMVDGGFQYVMSQLGLDRAEDTGRLQTMTVSSPFNLRRQARLCVPSDIPDMARLSPDEAATWLSEALYKLALCSSGRLLALFTSHALIKATASRLRTPLQTSGLALYAQGVTGNRTQVLRAFKDNPESVLLGAQSFWEGIDLPGDELTTLVIVRLPFTPPTHPVTEARHERIQTSGGNPFLEDSLPEAIVRFRQGFGRLIRTATDKGVVVVYDRRIIASRYGKSFLRSVPDVSTVIAPETEVYEQVRTFLRPGGGELE
jgi:ATP-dependent DNA helicase DinG